MTRSPFDAYEEEGKDYSTWDEKIDWSRSGSGFTTSYLSPVSSESDVPPPPPTDSSSYSTFAEHVSSSSFESNNDAIGDGATKRQLGDVEGFDHVNVEGRKEVGDGSVATYADDESHSRTSINAHLDNEVIDALALLEEYEEDVNSDCEESVEKEMPGNNLLDSFVAILNQFTLRCAFDHLQCIATKEKEKHKQTQRQQACLQLVSIARRVIVRRVFLVFNRIAWHESVVAAMRQRKHFLLWKDATAASRKRRRVLFLMMVFNRWRMLTEESVSMRQKNYASLMHWAERLTRRSFAALRSHARSQREERAHALDRYQSQTTFRSSFRSPEQSLAWRNSTDYTNRSFSSSSRYGGSGSFFQSITPSTRFNRNRFQELGSSQKASHSSYRLNFSSDVLQNSRRTALTQPDGSSHPR